MQIKIGNDFVKQAVDEQKNKSKFLRILMKNYAILV